MPSKTCPICNRRRGKRFCPGLPASRWRGDHQIICAPCCGEQREASIDCPADCPYLAAAHRYEAARPTATPEMPFPEVALDRFFLEDHQPLITGLAFCLCRFAADHAELHDPEALAALDSLARGFQTLDSGLYYEQPPEAPAARALYAAAQEYLNHFSQEKQQHAGTSLRPGEILRALVFFRRLAAREANARPLSRKFLRFLQSQLPADAQEKSDEPRLILPGS